ncbi:MAG: acyltransferase family protein, partial [Bacteroidia bacterium]
MNNSLTSETKFTYFKGLNALRFFAASLVVLMHIRSNQGRMGLEMVPEWPIFFKGLVAVSFFFVLSGFLITYILLKEEAATKTISIKKFYLKRVFRIWPLYFIIVAIGAAFYWYLSPKLGIEFHVDYNKSLALFLYVFFGANLMNSLYHVGGILHITWSIAVEEQFYLFWAPLMKKFRDNIQTLLITVFAISLTINVLNAYDVFGLTEGWKLFVHTLQFHYMALGGWFAYKLYQNPKKLMDHFFFRSKVGQMIPLTLLIAFLLFYFKIDVLEPILVVPTGLLFAWLILNVSVNPNKIFGLDIKPLNYLGEISYGIYMYHMIVVYAVSFVSMKVLATRL